MVNDLAFPIEVLGVETAREKSGLAMSSRNQYLTKDQRDKASSLRAELLSIAEQLQNSEQSFHDLTVKAKQNLEKVGFEPHYINIARQSDLLEAGQNDKELVILAAAQMGKARLIDNLEVVIKK